MTQGSLFSTGTIPQPKRAVDIQPKKPEFYTKNWLPIPKGAVSMISASGGAGKSFFAIQIACRLIEENPDRRVLLWLSEDPAGQTRERLDRVLTRIVMPQDASIYLNKIEIIGSDTGTPHIDIDNLSELQGMITPYSVVVFDPLIAFYPADENNNAEARSFMNMFTHTAEKHKQSIIFIHHHTKGSVDVKGSIRGAGAFVDAVRAVYELEVIEGSGERKINVTKDNWGVRSYYKTSKEFPVIPYDIVIEEGNKNEY